LSNSAVVLMELKVETLVFRRIPYGRLIVQAKQKGLSMRVRDRIMLAGVVEVIF
jgi:hypothetical protein